MKNPLKGTPCPFCIAGTHEDAVIECRTGRRTLHWTQKKKQAAEKSLQAKKFLPYGATTARAAAVRASADAIWLQSRNPRMKAPVGSL